MRKYIAVGWCVLAMSVVGNSVAAGNENVDLIFMGDAAFNGPHGGQAIHVVLIDAPTRKVVGKQSSTISPSENPSFKFVFQGVLRPGSTVSVRIWIDSNFGGGRIGKCDPKDIDHQWNYFAGTENLNGKILTKKITHLPADMIDICHSFTEK